VHVGQVSKIAKKPFYVIPYDCLDSQGIIDRESLAVFLKDVGLDNHASTVLSQSSVPAALIRCAREVHSFHSSTQVINPPGQYSFDNKIWSGLAALPGFQRFLEQRGISCDTESIVKAFVPTIVAKKVGNKILIAHAIDLTKQDELTLIFHPIEASVDLLNRTQAIVNSATPSASRKWVIKLPSTSGSHGVAFTASSTMSTLEKNVTQTVETMGIPDKSLFALQPALNSCLTVDGAKRCVKLHLHYIGKDFHFAGIDFLSTPFRDKIVHLSPTTLLGSIRLT
jgi:hypothetical protein